MEENKVIDLDALLASTDLGDVTPESAGFGDLPTGDYLSEVVSAELTTSKSSGKPMVSFRFKVIENGIVEKVDEEGNAYLARAKGTTNRNIFKHYVLDTQEKVKALASDMVKYEGEEPGKGILDDILKDENGKIVLPNTQVLIGCLEILQGLTIFVHADTRPDKNDPTKNNTFISLRSWDRATKLGLLEVPKE